MNFYTLTYDANLPTKQQINVPTNTDYKIGVKVVRNGDLVALKPSDVTLGTLSADAELEDGYVTFTKAAGDQASYTKLGFDVDYEPLALSARGNPSKNLSKASLELSANPSLAGQVVKANDFWLRKAIGSGTTATSADVVAALDQRPFQSIFEYAVSLSAATTTDAVQRHKEGTSQTDSVFTFPSLYIDTGLRAGQQPSLYTIVNPSDIPPKGVPYGFEVVGKDGTKPILKIVTQYTLQDNDVIVSFTSTLPSRTYKCTDVMVQLGQPFESKFKLLENVFKSQQGDLADISFDNTINIAGTLSDDTEFSYNALMK